MEEQNLQAMKDDLKSKIDAMDESQLNDLSGYIESLSPPPSEEGEMTKAYNADQAQQNEINNMSPEDIDSKLAELEKNARQS